MERFRRACVLALVASVTLTVGAGAAPILGQVDTFEDGGVAGWSVGQGPPPHPFPPTNIASGGPAGAADNYLQLQSIGGTGSGSRLSAFNMSQWAGDYLSAGIDAISMDLRNLGTTDLTIRLLLVSFGQMGPTNIASTLDAAVLPAGGAWTTVTFSLAPADLFVPLGTPQGALSQAAELRLFHNPLPVFTGPPNSSPAIAGLLGVDNIRALDAAAVPEPSVLTLLGGALCAAILRRRRARAA